jgi:hypothetical protein
VTDVSQPDTRTALDGYGSAFFKGERGAAVSNAEDDWKRREALWKDKQVDVAPGGQETASGPVAKADPAQLPSHNFKDQTGEDHSLYIKVEGDKAKVIKASTPTDITNAFDVADQIVKDVEAWLKMDAKSEDAQKLIAKIRSDMNKLLKVMEENRAPTDLAKKRQDFEKKLGVHAMKHGDALDTTKDMMQKVWKLLSGLAEKTKAAEESADDRLIKLAKKCGKDLESGFAGSVGTEFETLKKILLGAGNLRERCLIAYNFQDVIGDVAADMTAEDIKAVLSRTQEKEKEVDAAVKRYEEAKASGKKGAKAMFGFQSVEGDEQYNQGGEEFKKAKSHDKVTGREMDQKLPNVPLDALEDDVLRALGKKYKIANSDTISRADLIAALTAAGMKGSGKGEGNVLARSQEKREGSTFGASEDESKAVSFRGDEFLPFIEGEVANLIDERNEWVKKARELEMPLKAGISGTTHRFMNFGKVIGMPNMVNLRLAMIGYLIPMKAHSFHEIMTSARAHAGCSYTAGHYWPLDPLGEGELVNLAGDETTWNEIKAPPAGGGGKA